MAAPIQLFRTRRPFSFVKPFTWLWAVCEVAWPFLHGLSSILPGCRSPIGPGFLTRWS